MKILTFISKHINAGDGNEDSTPPPPPHPQLPQSIQSAKYSILVTATQKAGRPVPFGARQKSEMCPSGVDSIEVELHEMPIRTEHVWNLRMN